MKHASALLWPVLVLASVAQAAEIGPCNDLDRISFLVGQTRSYAEGKIRIAQVDTDGEPVCCSSHLLILIPSREIGSQCFALSQQAGSDSVSARGFSNIELSRIRAAYDSQRGLLLTVPYTLYKGDGGRGTPGSVNVRVNLSDQGSVRIER